MTSSHSIHDENLTFGPKAAVGLRPVTVEFNDDEAQSVLRKSSHSITPAAAWTLILAGWILTKLRAFSTFSCPVLWVCVASVSGVALRGLFGAFSSPQLYLCLFRYMLMYEGWNNYMMNECLRRVKGHSITLLVSLQREFNFKSLREEGKEE